MHYLQELPLALFTLMSQMAVGIVLCGWGMIKLSPAGQGQNLLRRQSFLALILLAVAAFISLAHTGSPLHGPFTLLGIGSSWLSREIATLGLVGLALLWLAWLCRKGEQDPKEGQASALVVIFGLGLIFVVNKVYNQPSIPGWNNAGVLPLFLATALILGAAWNLFIISLSSERSPAAINLGLFWLVLGYVLMAIGIPLALSFLQGAINPHSFSFPPECLPSGHALHAALSGLGLLFLLLSGLRVACGKGLSSSLNLLAFLLLLCGELVGRMVFYLSYVRLGM